MQQVVLFDQAETHTNLFPLTLTRSTAECIVGIDTIKEKWESVFPTTVYIKTVDYLQPLYSLPNQNSGTLYIAANTMPDQALVTRLKQLKEGEGLRQNGRILCYANSTPNEENVRFIEYSDPISQIQYPWDIFTMNGRLIAQDFDRITKGRPSQKIHETNTILGDPNKIFIEEGAVVRASILNAEAGCIYVGKNAEIMEGCIIRGPFALGAHGVTKLATKVYGPTTVGPYSKIGGEVNNSVLFSYSNKGHDGFLGNSVIGAWCNLGADTNNSNLKNNYGLVKSYNYREKKEIDTGLQFCGLIMGDHSKTGINTMFNTGTVCGVSANVFGGGFPPKHIPSFSWGGAEKMEAFQIEKALEVANRMMERRGKQISPQEENILRTIASMVKNAQSAL